MTTHIEPPVPEDLDLRKLDSFMLDRTRLLASRLWAVSTGEEFKAWFALIMRAWHEVPAGSLPNDDRTLAGFSGAGSRWPKIREIALHGWKLGTDGRWYHPVLCNDALRAREAQEKYERRKQETADRVAAHRNRKKQLEDGKVTPQVTKDVTRYIHARLDNDNDKDSSASAEQPRRNFSDYEMLKVALAEAGVEESPGDDLIVERWIEAGATMPFVKRAIAAKLKKRKGGSPIKSLAWFQDALLEALAKPTPGQRVDLQPPIDPAARARKDQEYEEKIAKAWAAGRINDAADMQARHEIFLNQLRYDGFVLSDRKNRIRDYFQEHGAPPPIDHPKSKSAA